jgi:hypothetical protein
LVFLLAWLDAGLGAVVGSILGNAAGRTGLFTGAILGGLAGTWFGVWGAARWGWLPPELRKGATWGGVLGFALAAPIAVTNLDTPLTAIVACGLVGAGALIGVGVARPR